MTAPAATPAGPASTAGRAWLGPRLSTDQRDVLDVVDSLMADRVPDAGDLRPEQVADARRALGEAGLWTPGVDERYGGGGADMALRLTVLARLGRHWAALGWASAQAHAAAELLGGRPDCADLLARIHDAEAGVCVVDLAAEHVRLEVTDGRVHGAVDRVDPAGAEPPHVLVLADADTAWVLRPDLLSAGPTLRRTGLGGAMTAALAVDGDLDTESCILRPADVDGVRSRLQLGAAAVAAGIAGAAAERALAYSRERQQFGGPLTALPTVRRSLFEQTAAASSSLHTVLGVDPSEPVQTAAALEGACEQAIAVCAASVQSHGGYGYLSEYDVERLLRDAVSLRAATDAGGAARTAASVLAGTVPAKDVP